MKTNKIILLLLLAFLLVSCSKPLEKAKKLVADGNIDDAIPLLESEVKKPEVSAELKEYLDNLYFEKGLKELSSNNFEKAIETFEKAGSKSKSGKYLSKINYCRFILAYNQNKLKEADIFYREISLDDELYGKASEIYERITKSVNSALVEKIIFIANQFLMEYDVNGYRFNMNAMKNLNKQLISESGKTSDPAIKQAANKISSGMKKVIREFEIQEKEGMMTGQAGYNVFIAEANSGTAAINSGKNTLNSLK